MKDANGYGNQWTGTSILKWACIKLWPAARSALNQSNIEGSSPRAGLKIDSVDAGLLVKRLDSGMGSTGGKDLPESEDERRDADTDGMPSPRPPTRNVSVIGKQAAHRDVVLWGKRSCQKRRVFAGGCVACRDWRERRVGRQATV